MDALTRKIADIEALQVRLAQSRAHLLRLVEDIQARPDDMDCAANAHRVLTNMLAEHPEALDVTSDDIRLLDATDRRQSVSSGRRKRRHPVKPHSEAPPLSLSSLWRKRDSVLSPAVHPSRHGT